MYSSPWRMAELTPSLANAIAFAATYVAIPVHSWVVWIVRICRIPQLPRPFVEKAEDSLRRGVRANPRL